MGGLGIFRLMFNVHFCFNSDKFISNSEFGRNILAYVNKSEVYKLIGFSFLCFLAEEGELYVFYGGSSFPSGNATRGCQKIDPCPGEKVIKIVPIK